MCTLNQTLHSFQKNRDNIERLKKEVKRTRDELEFARHNDPKEVVDDARERYIFYKHELQEAEQRDVRYGYLLDHWEELDADAVFA